jgi:CheY-like chemotaxis protein
MRYALESATNDTTYCRGSESSGIVGIGASVGRVDPHPGSPDHHPEDTGGQVCRDPTSAVESSQGLAIGLGLATVLEIVEQSSGKIESSGELGRGTSFCVDLPRVEGTSASQVRREYTTMPTGTETVLLVDDEEVVRELTTLLLKRQGYTVLAASHPSAGLSLCRSYPETIDLLLTDFLMPGRMNGLQLAEQAIQIRAGVRVLLMSGYTTDALERRGVDERVGFLQKPFTLQDLARKVREVLDTAPIGVPESHFRGGQPA